MLLSDDISILISQTRRVAHVHVSPARLGSTLRHLHLVGRVGVANPADTGCSFVGMSDA